MIRVLKEQYEKTLQILTRWQGRAGNACRGADPAGDAFGRGVCGNLDEGFRYHIT